MNNYIEGLAWRIGTIINIGNIMGQGQQKSAVQTQPQQNNKPNNKSPAANTALNNDKLTAYIREAFRNCSTNGVLTKDSFNQVLAVLESLGFKRLRDTPLADRLFVLFDSNKSGDVSEEEFSKGIGKIINDKNEALMYTFRAYDSDGDNKISKREFVQVIQESWRAAFRFLEQRCDGTKHGGVTIRDIENWSTSKVQILNEHSGKLFSKYDPQNRGFIEFQAFREYALNSGFNDITATIGTEKVVVPLNLTSLYAH